MKDNRKNILIFSTAYFPFVGGAEVAVREITDRVADDFCFDMITARMDKKLKKFENIGGINVYRIGWGVPFIDKLYLAFFGWVRAKKLNKNRKYLFSWSIMASFGGFAALSFKVKCGVPLLLTLQEGDDLKYIDKKVFFIKRRFLKIFKKADFIHSISIFLKEWAISNGAKSSISVIPNGVDISKFKRPDDFNRKEFRYGLGFEDNDKLIITTSRLVKKNGTKDLIESLVNLPSNFKLLILGDGDERDYLINLAKRLMIDDRVFFFGLVSHYDLPKYLWSSDVFCRPSLSEGLGNSFLEAMLSGLPTIATKVGGIPDFLVDGENGWFCGVENSGDIAEKIKQVFKDEKIKEEIVERAIKTVEDNYDWSLVAEKMIDLFNKIEFRVANKKLKILIATGIFPPDIGGPATYSKLLLEELPKKGFEPDLLSFSNFRNKYPKIISHIFYFFNIIKKGRRADIIYVQDPVSVGFPVALANIFLGKKMILKIVGDYAWEQGCQRFGVTDLLDEFSINFKKYSILVRAFKKIQLFSSKKANNVIVPSTYLKNIVTNWGIDPIKIKVIYNAFDGLNYNFSKEEARRALNIGDQEKIIISAGRLVPWKGFIGLIQAFKTFSQENKNSKLFIAGDGGEEKNIKKLIEDLELGDRVVLLGRIERDDLFKYIKASDIFALNTSYEGFSHQLLEVMALGVPIITTKVGGNTELINNEENGLLFDFNDINKLLELLLKLNDNKNLQDEISKKGLEKIREFNQSKMIEDLSVFLKEIQV
ncbi:MAG TPA: glycosyltransferase family 4 protein [bacterium]|nr:glycosyltransferase family 4 protein [bacterium]